MAQTHAKSGDLVWISAPLANTPASNEVLVRDAHIEIFRLSLPAGAQMQSHKAAGAMSVQCLSGEVRFSCHDQTHQLTAGALVYLQDAEPHALVCVQDAVLLITLFLHRC
ncbi:cupin domain-containing protein [Chitinimonas sp. PSY-7]|uniref:cupin domain-containing protein n=1 Tax=Chitinimonas sp. PSY-7 TaxID=3459088 RepID=UPI0040401586